MSTWSWNHYCSEESAVRQNNGTWLMLWSMYYVFKAFTVQFVQNTENWNDDFHICRRNSSIYHFTDHQNWSTTNQIIGYDRSPVSNKMVNNDTIVLNAINNHQHCSKHVWEMPWPCDMGRSPPKTSKKWWRYYVLLDKQWKCNWINVKFLRPTPPPQKKKVNKKR